MRIQRDAWDNTSLNPDDRKLLIRLLGSIKANLSNEQFSVEQLAEEIGLSRSHLYRKLNRISGLSISQFIREYRLRLAVQILKKESISISEVAYKVGFNSVTYFNKCFHDLFGYSPGQIRKGLKEKSGNFVYPSSLATSEIEKDTVYSSCEKSLYSAMGGLLSLSVQSVLVLPFKNLNNDPTKEYFLDGVTETIINHLSKIKELEVISRTTSMRYKKRTKTLPEISKELGVSHILEGSIQQHKEKVLINVRLINAQIDISIWSTQYEGEFENIFEIQSGIAISIAQVLNGDISESEFLAVNKSITPNPQAYEQFLRGKYLIQGNWSANRLSQSRKFFKEAIRLDPNFQEAYIWLAISYGTEGTWYGTLSGEDARSLSNMYYSKAMEIDPENGFLLENLAIEKYIFDWDFSQAEYLFEKASKGRVLEHSSHLNFYLALRRFQKVIDEATEVLKRDPYAGTLYWKLAYAYYHIGEKDKVLKTIVEGLEKSPEQEAYYDHFGNLYNALGMYKEAELLLTKGLSISNKRHASMIAHLAITKHYLRKEKKTQQLLEELTNRIEQGEPNIKVFLAHAYAGLHKKDLALDLLQDAYEDHEVEILLIQVDPNLLLLNDEEQYKSILKSMNFPKVAG